PAEARVALPARTPSQLVVDAPALVSLGTEPEQAARGDHLLALGRDFGLDPLDRGVARGPLGQGPWFVLDAEVAVAAELDVGAGAGHVGGDGDGAEAAGRGDDVRLLLVEARVQRRVRHAFLLEVAAQQFGLL